MTHFGTWRVQIYHQKEDELSSSEYPLLSFNMIIVTPCTILDQTSVTLNPEPFIWPLEDYTWAAIRGGFPEFLSRKGSGWSSSHPGFTHADCHHLASQPSFGSKVLIKSSSARRSSQRYLEADMASSWQLAFS